MEKQGASVADRPRMIAGEMFTGGLSIVFTHVGDRLRRMRRFVSRYYANGSHLTSAPDAEHFIRISSLK